VPDHGLRPEEDRLQVDVEDAVPVLLGHVPERRAALDARVVDEHVEPAERRGALRHEAADLRDLADVRPDEVRAPPHRPDLRGDAARRLGAAVVVHDDVGALAREPQRDGATDAAAAPRDEGRLALEPHGGQWTSLKPIFGPIPTT
jgi:hypothetical protein